MSAALELHAKLLEIAAGLLTSRGEPESKGLGLAKTEVATTASRASDLMVLIAAKEPAGT